MMAQEEAGPHPVRDVVDRLERMSGRADLTLGDLVQAFGTTSFVPALMIPALLVVSPLSGIPVFSSICGLTILLIALQMVFSRDHLWLPGWICRRPVRGDRLAGAMQRIRRLADWIDRASRNRLRPLTRPPGVKLPQGLAATSGAAMPFLELVPFSSSLLGGAVLLFSVSFLARDGLFVVAGVAVMMIAAIVPVFVWSQVVG